MSGEDFRKLLENYIIVDFINCPVSYGTNIVSSANLPHQCVSWWVTGFYLFLFSVTKQLEKMIVAVQVLKKQVWSWFPFIMISFCWRSASLPNTVQWLMPKLNVFMKSLRNQTRFAECSGVEQHTDETQLRTWRNITKLNSACLGIYRLCCGAYGRIIVFSKP